MSQKETLRYYLDTNPLLFWEDVERIGLTQAHQDLIDEETVRTAADEALDMDQAAMQAQDL